LYLAHFDFFLYYHSGCSIEKPNILSQRLDYSSGVTDNKKIILLYLELFTIYILKEVELTRVEQKVLSKIYHSNHKGDLEESVAKVA